VRLRHYSRRTEEAYVGWTRRYILFHGKKHPAGMGAEEVTRFLSWLAVEGKVSASTQNQALAALLFLYGEVLEVNLPWLADLVRASRPERLPVVLSREEVRAVLLALRGTPRLMRVLLYGTGLRLLECCRLRVKDVDFAANQIVVRSGKGDRDRVTLLPAAVVPALRRQVDAVRRQHEDDVRAGAGWVELPHALGRKYPNAGRELLWQWVFPRRGRIASPRPASAAGTTCTKPSSSGRCTSPSARPVSRSGSAAIPFGTRSRRISLKTATTSERCRSFWATATSGRR
jgi:integron integrase